MKKDDKVGRKEKRKEGKGKGKKKTTPKILQILFVKCVFGPYPILP